MLCEHLCPDFAIEVEVEKKPAKEAQSGSGA
jgi:NAD-dependent dihydropyrimidine dehydrogenase PreA subunit